ncbi:MAG: hypothetical protein JSR62_10670 [Nitrospira sp.]|nr:hypothetical protein [Nitrospira sp.]
MHDEVDARPTRFARRFSQIRNRGAHSVSGLLILTLVACAGPEPILKSTTYLQLHGKDQAEREAAVCGLKAERSGLDHGTNRSGNASAGATLGLIGGAAVGASAGLVGGPTGIAIGAAAGGAVGTVLGLLAGTYKPLQPRQEYAAFVERCLKEKGYETEGWQ